MFIFATTKNTEIMLSESITFRALELIKSGFEPIQAVKQALIDETNFLGTLVNGSHLSERGKIASEHLRTKIYDKLCQMN